MTAPADVPDATDVEPTAPRPGEPLGRWFGARSGDKGGNANVGIWARDRRGYAWLVEHLTVDALRTLLAEAAISPSSATSCPTCAPSTS